MTNILRYGALFGLFTSIFLSFSNIFLRLCQGCGYSHGLLSDYLIPKLYLVDIAVLATVILIFLLLGKKYSRKLFIKSLRWNGAASLFLACWLFLGIFQLSGTNPVIGLLQWWRITSYGLLSASLYFLATDINLSRYMIRTQQILPVVRLSVAISIVFQAFVSIYQWIYQKHLFGYVLFGEPLLVGQPGLAKKIVDGAEYILPYGTTAHPNVLGGLTALGLFFLVSTNVREITDRTPRRLLQKLWLAIHIAAMCAGFTIVLLSQSAAAALLLIFAGATILIKDFILVLITNNERPKLLAILAFSLLFLWIVAAQLTLRLGSDRIEDPSWHRRAYLLESSEELISQFSWKQITGVGLGQFTAQAPQQLRAYESARFNQPVHHVPLLVMAETGVFGLIILFVGVLSLLKMLHQTAKIQTEKYTTQLTELGLFLLVLTPLMVWDHYLWSIPPANVLFVIVGVFVVLTHSTVFQVEDFPMD
jgi:hypothetical protein